MKNQKFNFALAALAIIFIFYLLINRLENKKPARAESGNKVVMNTIAKITAIAPDKKTARLSIDSAFGKIYRLEKLMNRYDPNSQISKVNRLAAKEPIRVDKDLFDILQQSIYYSRKTDGAFDITVGPLVDLWKKCAEANSMPTEQQLAEVRGTVGYEKVILDANDFSVRFVVEGVSLDLGAIAKGFAADKAVEEMKRCGAVGGLVDIGGQIGCFGLTEKKGKWIVGIRNPAKAEDNQIIAKLAFSDKAVSTSGDYERFYKIGGKRFSHIFNPATEKNADQLASVTVIAANGTEADALATAVSVLGAEKGLEIIEKTENTEAIIIKAGSKDLIKSRGVERYSSR
jgi:thiamine biosynthesis lipoprotein